MSSSDEHKRDDSTEEERADRVADEVSRLVGRAREEAEDIWAEAQALRRQERPVMRRGLAYGLAGVIRASERIKAAARGAAEGARTASQSTNQTEGGLTEEQRPPESR
jgi:hypothetical protein